MLQLGQFRDSSKTSATKWRIELIHIRLSTLKLTKENSSHMHHLLITEFINDEHCSSNIFKKKLFFNKHKLSK